MRKRITAGVADANAVFGYTGGYGYASNGYWNGSLGPMAGLNDVTDSMTVAFTTPVAGVGGFMNYAPVSSNPTTLPPITARTA